MDSSWPETLQSNRQKVISELVKGEESAKQLRKLLDKACQNDGTPSSSSSSSSLSFSPEELVLDVLRSFNNTLNILHCVESDQVSQVPIRSCVKTEESEESSKSISPPRDRRGCYKRRKNCESQTKMTSNLADDGYQWRKYGQKSIMHSEFPRNYYRCTHRMDQGCPATKQVQMVSKNPQRYRITYHGHHTCRNLIRTPPFFLDPSCPNDTSIILSFNNQENTVHNANNNFPFNSSVASFPRKQGGDNGNKDNIVGQTQHSSCTAVARIQSSLSKFRYSADEATVVESHGGDMTVLSSTLGSDQGDVVSSSTHSNNNDNFDDIDILGSQFDDDVLQQFIMKIDA